MARVNMNKVPRHSTIDPGNYLVEVEAIEPTETKQTGKLMYKASFRIQESGTDADVHANKLQSDYWVIGSDEDPLAEAPGTAEKSIGMQRFVKLAVALGLELEDDIELNDLADMCTGQRCVIKVNRVPRDKKDPNSDPTNNVVGYYAEGDREVGLITGQETVAAGRPKAAKPAPARKAAPATPVEEEEETPAPAPARKPAAKPAGKKAAPKLACPICNDPFERSEMAAHVETCGE